jgi:subtilase family serine protease
LVSAFNNILAQANAQGMTIINASGDSGATDCEALDATIAVDGLNVDFPSSSPYVTSAGGTMFSGDINSPSSYWSSTNGANGGSAQGYITEQPWNETTALQGLGAGGAGGGGASAYFSKPSWQTGTGSGATPDDSSRDVPDISMNAAAEHDGYYVCSTGGTTSSGAAELSCATGSFLSSNGDPNIFGGTSFVAPITAGILALVEQHLGIGTSAATGLGDINSVLYGLANGPSYSSIFHDVTSGNISIPCSPGTPNCPNGGSIGFAAGNGYDQASGLGSFNVAALIGSWSSATPTGIGGVTSPGGITTTSLQTTASQLCGITAGNITLNVTVTGYTAAGAASTTIPTGTVQFFIDSTPIGSPQPLVNGSLSNFSLSTAGYSGGHNISAVYSGDASYTGSKGTLLAADGTLAAVDMVSSTNPDFSITPCTGAVSVNPGATSTGVVFTVTPVNGFTGSVNMIVTNNNEMVATPSFSVKTVSLTSTTGVTTSFIVVASEPASSSAKARPTAVPGQHTRGKAPWYAAGSGATLACVLLFTMPRRRRWAALLAAVLSVAALTAVGCSSSSTSAPTTGGGGGTPTAPVTEAAAGTYTFTITGVATGGLVHSTQVTVTVP